MKVIKQNLISSVSANSELSTAPASNTLDEHPQNTYETDGTHIAVLTINVAGGSSGLFIGNTNARMVDIVVRDPNYAELWNDTEFFTAEVAALSPALGDETGDPLTDHTGDPLTSVGITMVDYTGYSTEWFTKTPVVSTQSGHIGNAYGYLATYGLSSVPVEITATVTTTSGENVSIGVLDAGEVLEFRNPNYGANISATDKSGVVVELDGGGTYYDEGTYAKQYAGVVRLYNEDWERLDDFARIAKYHSRPWQFVDERGARYSLYGRFVELPSVVVETYAMVDVSIKLIEEL